MASCLYFFIFYNFTAHRCDEGILLVGAERILTGQVLYRDFFSFYTPGSYYLLALLFKLFGSSILVGRAALVVCGGLFTALLYLLARRVASRKSALLVAYLLTITCVPATFTVLHNWDSTLWACLALYCALWMAYQPRATWALGLGGFASLTCLFEQSKGAGLVAGLAVGFFVLMLNRDIRPARNRRWPLALAVGFGGPFLVTFSYFGFHHGLHALFTDWFWPLGHYSAVNRLPFGYLDLPNPSSLWQGPWSVRLGVFLICSSRLLFSLLPLAALGVLARWILRIRRRKWTGEKAAYYVLCSSCIGGLLLGLFATGRPDFAHLFFHGPLFFLPLAWILDGRDIPSRLLFSLKDLLVLVCLVSFTLTGMLLLLGVLNAHARLVTRRGTLKAAAPDGVLAYVQAHVAPGEQIFVYPYDPLYYYLTATRNPTPYEFLFPGMNDRQQYAEALQLIASHPPRVVLLELELSLYERLAPVFPALSPQMLTASDPLREYLLTRYRPCAILPNSASAWFVFMVRNGSDCAGAAETHVQPNLKGV